MTNRAEVQHGIVADDLDLLLGVLPGYIAGPIRQTNENTHLLEIVMDLGRLPQARYTGHEIELAETEVTAEDIDYVVAHIGDFGEDNRAGIERTLHRISCLRNRRGRIVGLTCRVGRAVFGTIQTIDDMVRSGRSILLLGRPGVGKTTMLREVARVLADDVGKRVVIVDTSNEIAGDGDIPHPAIGRARRMQVARPDLQHAVMIEAVENHMPEVIVIDEIGTELEAIAARTIAERGVQLVGTAHGNHAREPHAQPDAGRPHRRHPVGDALRRRSAPPRDAEVGSGAKGAADVRRRRRDPELVACRAPRRRRRDGRCAACAAIASAPPFASSMRAARCGR